MVVLVAPFDMLHYDILDYLMVYHHDNSSKK